MKPNFAMAIFISIALSACSTTPKTTTPQTSQPEIPASGEQAGRDAQTGVATSPEVSAGELAVQLQDMQKNSVYFDFDSYAVKPEYGEIIRQRADLLKSNRNIIVTLQGNTDERGSSEFNLSLGDRRANAVRKSLEQMGVPDGQIKSVSLGEEHPRLTCHEEQCWKENRRVDFSGKQGS